MTGRLKAALGADADVLGLNEHQLQRVLRLGKRRVPGLEIEVRLRAELRFREPALVALIAQSVIDARDDELGIVRELLSEVVFLRLKARCEDEKSDFHLSDAIERVRKVVARRIDELRGSFGRDTDENVPAEVAAVREKRRSELVSVKDIGQLVQKSFNDVFAFLPRADD